MMQDMQDVCRTSKTHVLHRRPAKTLGYPGKCRTCRTSFLPLRMCARAHMRMRAGVTNMSCKSCQSTATQEIRASSTQDMLAPCPAQVLHVRQSPVHLYGRRDVEYIAT